MFGDVGMYYTEARMLADSKGLNMKTFIQLSIILLCTLSIFSTSSSNEMQTNNTYLSVLNVREDLIHKTTTNEILLFAQFSKGKYKVVSHWDNNIKDMISQRKSILEKHKKFKVYRHGELLGELTVSEVHTAPFDCEELFVGSSHENIIHEVKKYESNTSETFGGFNQNGKFEYKNTRFLAINSDSPSIQTQQRSRPLSTVVPENTKNLINKYAANALVKQNNQIKETDIKITTLLSYDFNNDSNAEYLVVAKGENDNTKQSGIFVLKIEGSKVIPLLNKGIANRPSSWGNGYELLDVLDIDGDKIPELIFETKGYESTGYDIYKLKNNKYIIVFSDITYGC